jgi:eukaryotic-like serine/threonine-protein kinase
VKLPLSPGSRLGPYEILAPLGAGGMGEVYRARDPRLGREVAIKVLFEDANADPERLRRFELEAKAVGTLSHPNLVAVFDTGRHEGAPFVVFELLPGETLRARLSGGALPPPKALDYAIQMARGLAAAHDKGIVHRDLKPDNVFLTRDGQIKILDFGLAKLRPPLDPGDVSPGTRTASVVTEANAIVGTAGYMSPEQVRRFPVDHRSDIFSFGSVLYEMLAGSRPFQAETQAETMTAILNQDPPTLAGINGRVSPALQRIVRHCLEKRPEDRFQSARDLAFDLESVAGASDILPMAGESGTRPRRRALPVLAAAVLGGAVVLAGAFLKWPRASEPLSFRQVTFQQANINEARFLPDGQTIIYGAAIDGRHSRLFASRLGSPEVRALDLPEGRIAAISPSGEMAIILGRSYHGYEPGTLVRVSLAGGAPRELLEKVSGADWGPRGASLAVVRHDGARTRLEFPIGKVLYQSDDWIASPRVSPDGERVAFLERRARWSFGPGRLRVVDLSGRTSTLVTGEFTGVNWSPKGDEIWFSDWGALRAVTLEGRERILASFPDAFWVNDVFPDGRVLANLSRGHQRLMVAGPGQVERDLAWFEQTTLGTLSADGKVVLFSDRGPEGATEFMHTYLRRTDGSPAVRLGEGSALSLSPDGRWAISLLAGPPARCLLLPTGPGEPKPLPVGDLECRYASWFPDGQRLLVWGRKPGRSFRVFLQDLEGREQRPLTPEGFAVHSETEEGSLPLGSPAVSPDGKLVAVADPQRKLVLFSVGGGAPRPIPAARPRETPVGWSADSQSLYMFSALEELPARIDRIDLRSGRRELFKQIALSDPAASGMVGIVFAPGGEAYAYNYGVYLGTLYVLEGVR